MRILILGAAGQIGSIALHALRPLHEVVGTSRREAAGLTLFDPFTDDWSSLGRFDVVINCIGQIDATATFSFYTIHVVLTKLMVENRVVIGNPRIIHVSALGAASNHHIEFLKTKGIADEHLIQLKNAVIVRPSIVCTRGTMLVRKMLLLRRIARRIGNVIIAPSEFLNARIQPVMPEDLADVFRALCSATTVSGVVKVVGPAQVSFGEIIKRMFDAPCKKYRLILISKRTTDIIAVVARRLFPQWLSGQQYQLLFSDNVADKNDVEKLLGRSLLSTAPFFINEFHDAGY